jgi:putative tryptophan/tyrosine transport system substrate-binding protein
MVSRRRFLSAITAGALALPGATQAQPAGATRWRLGVLLNLYAPTADPPQALRQGLREFGYVEGQNLVIDWRHQLGRGDRLAALAAELIQAKPDVIVADVTFAIRAAMRATSTIPIVMASSADAVGTGIVASLAQPGANVTGITIMLAEMSAKRLQLLKEAVPGVSRVAVLWNPDLPWHPAMLKEVERAGASLRVQSVPIAVRGRGEAGITFTEIRSARADALFVSETMTPPARRQVVEFAVKNRLPSMFMNPDYVTVGGLMSYAPSFSEMFRQAAEYVDKIFKGARPRQLPVAQPTKFELVVNAKTARALGLTIPPTLLAQADEILE